MKSARVGFESTRSSQVFSARSHIRTMADSNSKWASTANLLGKKRSRDPGVKKSSSERVSFEGLSGYKPPKGELQRMKIRNCSSIDNKLAK